MKGAAPLIEGVSFDALPADDAFDADWLPAELDERGVTALIPPKANREEQRAYDRQGCKRRHLVENDLAKINEFKCIATRREKTLSSYTANRNLAAMVIAAR